MQDRFLYTQPIPSDSQTNLGSQIQRQVAELGSLRGNSSAKAISLDPSERMLTGQYSRRRAGMMAAEMEELFDAAGFESVPYWGEEASTEDGYYVLHDVSSGPLVPQAAGLLHTFDGMMKRIGARESHLLSVATNISEVDNDFGSDEEAYIGILASASNPRWLNSADGSTDRTEATPVATRTSEHGDVAIYDVEAAPYSQPTLIYDLAYDLQADADCRVWDSRSGSQSRNDSNGVRQWQKVYTLDHTFSGATVLSNGLVRLTADGDGPLLYAESWDSGSSTWTATGLGSESDGSNWVIDDVDVFSIGPAAIEAQLMFYDANGDSYFALDARLNRGAQSIQFTTPSRDRQGPTPTGLQDLLGPIASTARFSPGDSAGLIARDQGVRL